MTKLVIDAKRLASEVARTVRDLTSTCNIKGGTKIEVLWTIENLVTFSSEKVWWTAVVLKPTGRYTDQVRRVRTIP